MLKRSLCKAVVSICLSALTVCNSETIQTTNEYKIVETMPLPRTHDDVIADLKEEVRYTAHWDEECYDDTIQISYEDAQILLKIAYSEGGNQGIQGQLKIMQTVWNRVQSDDPCFPDTIYEVVHQKGGFSSVANGTFDTAEPTWETHIALSLFEQNKQHDSDLIGFETKDNGETLLKYFDFLYEYGDHVFYKIKEN